MPREARSAPGGQLPPSRYESWLCGRGDPSLCRDAKHSDSVQSTVERAVKTVTGKDGALAMVVREVFVDAMRPLETEVDRLTKEVRGQDAAKEALSQTTKKGATYIMQFDGDRIAHMTKVWNAGLALKDLGWA